MTLLDVRDLRAGYGSAEILAGISFRIEAGKLVGILGANGSGKTTLLKALCGIHPSRGEILLCGRELRTLSPRQTALYSRYIPQRSGISADLSVLDVVLMGFNPQLKLLEYPTAAMRETASAALQAVGLAHRAQDSFLTLSEGQKQLCILARTMLLERGMLFLDEPESALDFSGRYQILALVRSFLTKSQSGALVTLHDPQLALNTCDRLLLLKNGILWKTLNPGQDSVSDMAEALSGIYGSLSIHTCQTRDGRSQFVLLKEE